MLPGTHFTLQVRRLPRSLFRFAGIRIDALNGTLAVRGLFWPDQKQLHDDLDKAARVLSKH